MSDTMLHSVLCMPPELWSDDFLDKMQRYKRYVQASRRIEDQERDIERLQTRIAALRDALSFFDNVQSASESERIAVGQDHWDWVLSASRYVVAPNGRDNAASDIEARR